MNLIQKQVKFSIIIYSYNSGERIIDLAGVVRSAFNVDCEIFGIAPGKHPGSYGIEWYEADWRSLPFGTPLNKILRRTAGKWILILNDNLALDDTIFANITKLTDRESASACITAGSEFAGFFAFNRQVLETIGGLDERFSSSVYALAEYIFRAETADFSKTELSIDTNEDYEKAVPPALWDDEPLYVAKTGKPLSPANAGERQITRRELTEEQCGILLEEGNQLIVDQKIEAGLSKYDEILDARPNFIRAIHNRSAVLYQAGKKDEGLEGLQRALRIDPTFAETYGTLGLISESEGRIEEAHARYKECIERDIDNENAFTGYERTAKTLGIPFVEEQVDFLIYTGGFVTFDGSTIHKRGLGGSESALYYIAKHIASHGYNVKVFNNCETPGVYDNVEYRDISEFYLFSRWNKPKVLICSRSFKPIVNGIRGDFTAVWLHDWPNVVYLDQYDFSKFDFSEFKLFTLSQSQTGEWKRVFNIPDDTFFITRNGYDPEMFKPMDIPRKRNKLIYASRPIRGLEVLLDIFPKIREEIPDAELHVFSYMISDRDKEIQSFKESMNQPGVILRGAVPQQELGKELAESGLLTYPGTFKETSCIIAIQAQACGLPVITTKLAALPETVQHENGGIIIEGDPHSDEYKEKFLAETLRLLKDENAWEEQSRAGQKRMLEEYTWENTALEWINYIADHCPGITKPAELKMSSEKKAKLSLCMIVKNEEKTLPVCLDSVRDIVDEIVIVDTGSMDRTAEIAEQYGATVKQFEWIDDFSAARNESIKHATGDWILYLDADEKITEETGRRIREVIERNDIMAVNMVEHIPQQEGNLFKTAVSDYCRLFRNDSRLKFTGRVHEQILPSINDTGGAVLKTDIRIDHWGFGLTEEKRKAREQRNLNLLLIEEKDAPDDLFVKYNIGMTYASIGDRSNALTYLKESVTKDDGSLKNAVKSTAFSTMAQILFAENHFDAAWKSAEAAVQMEQSNLLAYYIMAGISMHSNEFTAAEEILLNLAQIIKNSEGIAEIDLGQLYTDLGNCAYQLKNVENAAEWYNKAVDLSGETYELLYNLGTCMLNKNDLIGAEAYFRKARDLADDPALADRILDEIQKAK